MQPTTWVRFLNSINTLWHVSSAESFHVRNVMHCNSIYCSLLLIKRSNLAPPGMYHKTHQNLGNWLGITQPTLNWCLTLNFWSSNNLRQNRSENANKMLVRSSFASLPRCPVERPQFMGIISWRDASMDILKTNSHTHFPWLYPGFWSILP